MALLLAGGLAAMGLGILRAEAPSSASPSSASPPTTSTRPATREPGAAGAGPAVEARIPGPDCRPRRLTVRGNSLAPLLGPGDRVQVWPRGCVALAPGGLAVFETPANPAPVIKRIAARPGQTLALDGPHLRVDGRLVPAPGGGPYRATARGARMLALYEGELAGYLLLGRPGALDSSRLGPIPEERILGLATPLPPTTTP